MYVCIYLYNYLNMEKNVEEFILGYKHGLPQIG